MIDEDQLIAPKPDVDYRNLSAQPSPEEFFLLSRVTAPVSVKKLCTTSGLGRDKTIAAVERLIDFGLLEPVGNAGGSSSPQPPPAEPVSSPQPPPAEPVSSPQPAQPVSSPRPPPAEPVSSPQPPPAEPVSSPDPPPAEPVAMASSGPAEPSGFKMEDVPSSPASGGQGAPISEADDDDLFSAPRSDQGSALDDDDDLFMPTSPAHISRVEGRAPTKREHRPTPVPNAQNRGLREKPQPSREEPPPVQPDPAKKPVPSTPDKPARDGRYELFPEDFDAFDVDPSRLADGVDEELQRELFFVHSQIDRISYYQLFGVQPDADRRTIKKAYFKLSKRFHPDKFFRDESVEIAERVEEVFKFVTKAYNTLKKKKKRAEYDQKLQQQQAQEQRDAEGEQRKREMAAELLAKRAAQLEQQGELVAAAGELRKVASIQRDPEVLLRAANLLLRANAKLDEAASFARAARKGLPERTEPHLLLGQIYEKNGLFAEAIEAFEQAGRIAPDDPAVQIHLERVRSQSQ